MPAAAKAPTSSARQRKEQAAFNSSLLNAQADKLQQQANARVARIARLQNQVQREAAAAGAAITMLPDLQRFMTKLSVTICKPSHPLVSQGSYRMPGDVVSCNVASTGSSAAAKRRYCSRFAQLLLNASRPQHARVWHAHLGTHNSLPSCFASVSKLLHTQHEPRQDMLLVCRRTRRPKPLAATLLP